MGWLCDSVHEEQADHDHIADQLNPRKHRKPVPTPAPAPSMPNATKENEPVPKPTPGHPQAPPKVDKPVEVSVEDDSDATLKLCGLNAAGVRLRFDGIRMRQIDFRASMPLMCLACGSRKGRTLLAVPIAWVDKATGHMINASEVEHHHRQHVGRRPDAKSVVELMSPIDGLAPPFNRPMPYFACERCAEENRVTGRLLARSHGVECEVIIPSGKYALRWVATINGADSPAYIDLKQRIEHLDTGQWLQLPQRVRERLAGWFGFIDEETFLAYFCDVDYTHTDEGYGGLVVTDHRLVYQKFARHGVVRFDRPGKLTIKTQGAFNRLEYESGRGSAKKMVDLRPRDVDRLTDLIQCHLDPLELYRA